MVTENIFTALAKYNSAKGENYLTEAFVYLINSILQKDRSLGCSLLNLLCVENSEFNFKPDEDIVVTTQEVTDLGGLPSKSAQI